jgi:site-specific recombinase XerC
MTGPVATPLDPAVDSFARYLRAANRSPKTVTIYLAAVRKLVEHLTEHAPDVTAWEALRAEHVNAFTSSILESGRSAAYASNLYRAIQQFVKWCLLEEEMVLDPLQRTTAPLVPEQPVPVLNVDQLRALLDVCEGREFSSRRDMAIIRLFLDTGIRLAELTALELDDVDLDHREATVLGKGRRRRTVVFGHKATLALDRYIRVRAAQRRADLPQLWLSLTGRAGHGPMTGSGIAQMIERRGQAAGITGLHPHVLRHTWAHYARLEDRLHDDEIMRLAGWRSRSMLNRYAASAADERARDAGKRSSLGDQL